MSRGLLAWCLALALVSSADQAQAQAQTPKRKAVAAASAASAAEQAFNEGKAMGQTMAPGVVQGITTPGSTAVVPAYSSTPPQSQIWSSQDFGTPLAQQQAACAANPQEPSCAGMGAATLPRPRWVIPASDPSRASAPVARDPSLMLGDMASTYSACTVGTPTLLQPAQYQRRACSLSTSAWTQHPCEKTLDVVPGTRYSCLPGTWFARAEGSITGLGWTRAEVRCDLEQTGVLSTFQLSTGTPSGLVTVALPVDQHTPAQAGGTPPLVATFGTVDSPYWGAQWIQTYAWGPGCRDGQCSLSFYFFAGEHRCVDQPGDNGPACAIEPAGHLETRLLCPAPALATNELIFKDCDQDGCRSWRGDGRQCAKPGGGGLSAAPLGSEAFSYWSLTSDTPQPSLEPLVVPGAYPVSVLNIRYEPPSLIATASETWQSSCQSLEAKTSFLPRDGVPPLSSPVMTAPQVLGQEQCVRTQSSCVDGPSTKLIDGVSVTRECWRWANTFACASNLPGSDCANQAGCSLASALECQADDGQGHCLSASASLDCKVSEPVYQPVMNCGDASFCSGGSCWETSTPPNGDFAFAVASLEARNQAAAGMDPANLRIFVGNANSCDIDSYGLRSCCNEAGDLISCPQSDRTTVQLRKAGLCHEVGNYCHDRDFFGGCISRRYMYCCFPSMLGRIVQEQGRPQLPRDWGRPEQPNCEGFTVEEFQHLDWSRIDLSEFFDTINPTVPDASGPQSGAGAKQTPCYWGAGRCGS